MGNWMLRSRRRENYSRMSVQICREIWLHSGCISYDNVVSEPCLISKHSFLFTRLLSALLCISLLALKYSSVFIIHKLVYVGMNYIYTRCSWPSGPRPYYFLPYVTVKSSVRCFDASLESSLRMLHRLYGNILANLGRLAMVSTNRFILSLHNATFCDTRLFMQTVNDLVISIISIHLL